MKNLFIYSAIVWCSLGSLTAQKVPECNENSDVVFTDEYTATTSLITESKIPLLQVTNLLKIGTDLRGGIKATVSKPGGYAELSVYSYNKTDKAIGKLLYSVKLTANSGNQFAGTPSPVRSAFLQADVMSDQIKVLLQDAANVTIDPGLPGCSVLSTTNLFKGTLASSGSAKVEFQNNVPLYQCLKAGNFPEYQPIVIRVKAKDIVIYGVKIPGLTEGFDLCDFFRKQEREQVDVYVNGRKVKTYTWADKNDNAPINVKLGDSVSFSLSNLFNPAPQQNLLVEGVPRTWVTPFAGDMYYYCSPSITPGDFTPWIGLDSRVHTLMMLKYPKNFQRRISDWKFDRISDSWGWGFTADRLMDATKTKYVAPYTWPKYKTLPDGTHQRNNQKEGLNIQYLTYWANWQTSNFVGYDGDINYMMGFDDDELMYLNSPFPDAKTPGHQPPPPPEGGILKLERLKWKEMPEGEEQLYDVETGFPAQGFPLNEMVTAYQKNRETELNNNDFYTKSYNGYEIQDLGTNEQNPNGTGTGNAKHPGKVTIWYEQQPIDILFNVTTPLAEDRGFYGSLEGTKWPSFGETNVPYTLTGLKNLSLDELRKFSMVYSSTDRLGDITEKVFLLKDLSESAITQVRSTGRWTSQFDIGRPGYAWVTAYYQSAPGVRKVMVAGKDLYPIFLLFCGVKNGGGLNLDEGEGQGSKIFLEDYRDKATPEFNVPRQFGNKTRYTSKFTRTYVVKPATTLTFTTWDGDPHMFYSDATEFYLGSKAMASRVPDKELTTAIKYYIGPVNGTPTEVTAGRNGKELTYLFGSPGNYQLRVVYRNGSEIYHQIKVVRYPELPGKEFQANINRRNLTADEERWLGIPSEGTSNLRVFEINDLYSQYAYVEGYRVNAVPGKPNRWAKFNDYQSFYRWYKDPDASGVMYNDPASNAEAYQQNYDELVRLKWFWPNWANHYSSNWLRPPVNGVQGLPYYVAEDQVVRLYGGTEINQFDGYIKSNLFTPTPVASWQYVIPLISWTDYQGYRMRTNPSCIYSLPDVFHGTRGAFSGNPPNPPDPENIQAPDITDDQKNQQDFYYSLMSGQKIILKESVRYALVNNVNLSRLNQETFIAQTVISKTGKVSTQRIAGDTTTAKNAMDEEATHEVTLYPNPSKGNFTVDLGEEVTGDVRIEILDISGRPVMQKTETYMGVQQVEINVPQLKAGTYLVNIRAGTLLKKRKIIIN